MGQFALAVMLSFVLDCVVIYGVYRIFKKSADARITKVNSYVEEFDKKFSSLTLAQRRAKQSFRHRSESDLLRK